jgi:hypothetical protein
MLHQQLHLHLPQLLQYQRLQLVQLVVQMYNLTLSLLVNRKSILIDLKSIANSRRCFFV